MDHKDCKSSSAVFEKKGSQGERAAGDVIDYDTACIKQNYSMDYLFVHVSLSY